MSCSRAQLNDRAHEGHHMYVCMCTFGSSLIHAVLPGLSNSCTIFSAMLVVVDWKVTVAFG
jgi:hypothetical protein